MNSEIKQVALRLKGLRDMLHISVEEMAKITSVSSAEYESYESGEKDLSFAFLYKCANRMGVDVSEIVKGTTPKLSSFTITRSGEGTKKHRRSGFEHHHLADMLKDRLAEPYLIDVKYSAEDEKNPIKLSTHNGQELNYILKGTLKVMVGTHEEVLNEGDSIYYDALTPHGMIAINGGDCQFLAVAVKGTYDIDVEPKPVDEKTAVKPERKYDKLLYSEYVKETYDENNVLSNIEYDIPDSFNFAYDVVDKLAEEKPEKVAMVWESVDHETKKFTFKDISTYSSKAANYFMSLGIKKGDKVMLVMKRHYEFWFAIIALHKIGAVTIPATNQLMVKDFVYRFNSAGVKAIVCTADGDVSLAADAACADSPTVEIKQMVHGVKDGWGDFMAGVEAASADFVCPEENKTSKTDPMLMYFTSGTTGYPKITIQSYAYPLGHVVTARHWHNVDPDGLHFTVSDTGWAKSMWGKLYGQWLCEAAVFTYDFDRFDADDILKMFAKHQITTFCAPPTMFRMFIKCDLSKYDLSSLKYTCIAGEALNPEVYNQFLKHTGLKMMEGFGQTETTLTIANLFGMEPKPGSMGKPNPQYQLGLIDNDGNEVNAGDVGEIVIYTNEGTPCGMFSGYYQAEEQTKSVWDNGVYHTGDMAWRDEDGYFWYVSRKDDIIKSSGYRIGPFEIESVLMELPYVLECAVTGVPDEVRGQLVKATIVLVSGTDATDELKKEIQEYVKAHTAPYKYPRIIEFVTELPKTISGKIRRVELREEKK